MSGSGITISCSTCGSVRELTVDEVTNAPTPTEAAEKVLEAEGWDTKSIYGSVVCNKCIAAAVEKEIDEEANGTPTEEIPVVPAPATMPKDEDLDFELPVKASRKLNIVEPLEPDGVAQEEYTPNPVVIFEEKDVRIVFTSEKFDGGWEEILVVERAHRVKDAMGKTRYAAIDLGNSIWVIQELARALYERETGQKPPSQQRVYMGGSLYIPTPNVV